ncbi:MAG TPA: hypothetical protein VIB78_00990 [Acidimicrobiia bacterium]|jgi:hypothetical protein
MRRYTLVAAVLSVLLVAQPALAAPKETLERSQPLEILELGESGWVVRDSARLSLEDRTLAELAAYTLNVSIEHGLIEATGDLSTITVTDSGRRYFEDWLKETTNGCFEVSSVSATWRGFDLSLNQLCDGEADKSRPSDSSTAPAAVQAASSGFVNSDPFGCTLSVTGVAIGVTSIFLTLATGPLGVLATVSLAVSGAGTFVSYIGMVQNCTGVLKVERVKFSTKRVCPFVSNTQYRWSSVGSWYAPIKKTHTCQNL